MTASISADFRVDVQRRRVVFHHLKLPRVAVLRRLQDMVKHGYVERVGTTYRITDKVNITELQKNCSGE